ncbi:TPA: ribosomal protein S18-alanine N-acetyltransferase [Mannheimia haemolytica]|uniref:[Ribosomal protein bS18]-alanine N-acetyltransferase n=1 Tax=Mannheimia haemolytica TaxID=75985 RepID=A0A248ZX01_MANHA|nr:ribosomal protein S18-alanine N-acetyltransferase [Mannheimia haemolytica]AWW70653.1 ribosomal-protein-alanine N-acetyltransferase RimI [Pasteurellaceae bacterium 12565]AGI31725.1 ribosomal-protein-alanine N-acetyltransferase RimI [Mannheimia haemolytica USDA-ARS-USMARC-183]AGI36169.1 ribosomal-protein-alanine N-acetyltransferase RimI [Mannheimia haemolytica USDA-ARS-USMARC-185]AGK00637.1 ribosomal-protein-S18-alanine N-acetyltransferase RimI [Mannheimia haemolytica M42548]AGQ25498.1 alanin
MIEQIQAEDFEQLFEIEQQAHLVPWSKGTLLNNQGEKYLNLKVVEQNKIVAFAISHIVLDEATLFNIAVAPDFQGKGIGKRLLSELILQLQQRKLTTLWLEVRESNHSARKLYDSLGFNEVTTRKNYYPTPNGSKENAVVMALYL